MRLNSVWRKLIILSFLLFMVVPVLATLIFSFSTLWYKTIWPENYTLEWWQKVLTNRNFSRTLMRSLHLSLITSGILTVMVTPSVYWVNTKLPKAKTLFEFMTALSFGIPSVILALTLIRFYSQVPWIPVINSPRILVCGLMVMCFPFMYRPVANALDSIDVKTLTEAAERLGAGWWSTLYRVIIPNMFSGIINGFLLTFSTVFSEFALTNMLVGSRYKTFPLFIVEFTRFDSRQASALAVISFAVAWLISLLILVLTTRHGLSSSNKVIGGH